MSKYNYNQFIINTTIFLVRFNVVLNDTFDENIYFVISLFLLNLDKIIDGHSYYELPIYFIV